MHHAVNDKYLDKNYGGIFIVWDRLFGSFIEEDDAVPCVYGTRGPLRSWNPLWANLHSVLFIAVLTATTLFLWFAHRLTLLEQAVAAAAIFAALWAVGRVCERAAHASVFSRKTALRGLRPEQE